MIKLRVTLDKDNFLDLGVAHQKGFLKKVVFGQGGEKPLPWVEKWLKDYEKGVASAEDVQLDYTELTPFQKKVIQEMQKVPFGKTITYKELAIRAGSLAAYRAVANVCAKNLWPLFVPCHRIVRSNGELGGFAYGIDLKKALLQFEKTKNS